MFNRDSEKLKILVVGQTPPPFGGQAIMINEMLKGVYKKIRFYHVRMSFSSEMDEIGKFKVRKMWHLLNIISQIIYFKLRYNISVLYYPPGGKEYIPMYRDLVILNCTRWLFKKTIFHFHAAGVSRLYPEIGGIMRTLYKRAYFYPDLAVLISESAEPNDGSLLKAKKIVVMANGISDRWEELKQIEKSERNEIIILFVGMIRVEKGIEELLQACYILDSKGIQIKLQVVGKFESEQYKDHICGIIQALKIDQVVEFLGVRTGIEKYKIYKCADIFSLPSYMETFGLVCVEAMQCSLPVVVSDISALRTIVSDNTSGFLVPVRDSIMLASALEKLAVNKELRELMGAEGRKIYKDKFTIQYFWKQIDDTFATV